VETRSTVLRTALATSDGCPNSWIRIATHFTDVSCRSCRLTNCGARRLSGKRSRWLHWGGVGPGRVSCPSWRGIDGLWHPTVAWNAQPLYTLCPASEAYPTGPDRSVESIGYSARRLSRKRIHWRGLPCWNSQSREFLHNPNSELFLLVTGRWRLL